MLVFNSKQTMKYLVTRCKTTDAQRQENPSSGVTALRWILCQLSTYLTVDLISS